MAGDPTDGGLHSPKFLHELKDEAQEPSREFEALFVEVMKLPQERHISG